MVSAEAIVTTALVATLKLVTVNVPARWRSCGNTTGGFVPGSSPRTIAEIVTLALLVTV